MNLFLPFSLPCPILLLLLLFVFPPLPSLLLASLDSGLPPPLSSPHFLKKAAVCWGILLLQPFPSCLPHHRECSWSRHRVTTEPGTLGSWMCMLSALPSSLGRGPCWDLAAFSQFPLLFSWPQLVNVEDFRSDHGSVFTTGSSISAAVSNKAVLRSIWLSSLIQFVEARRCTTVRSRQCASPDL